MHITQSNLFSPRNLLLSTVFATTLSAAAYNCNQKDLSHKQNIEIVDKTIVDKFINAVKTVDNYDTRVIDNIR